MQTVPITRDNWIEEARRAGVTLELLAALTGKSYAAVYKYHRGTRRPPDAWVAQAGIVITARAAGVPESAA